MSQLNIYQNKNISNSISCGQKLNTSMESNPLYWQRVKAQLEARNTKEASIALRKKMIDDQNKINYSNEYKNIRGILSSKRLPFITTTQLTNRAKQLKELGAKAFAIS